MASKLDNLNSAIEAIDAKISKLYYRRSEIEEQIRRCTASTASVCATTGHTDMGVTVSQYATPSDDPFLRACQMVDLSIPGVTSSTDEGQTRKLSDIRRERREAAQQRDPSSFFS